MSSIQDMLNKAKELAASKTTVESITTEQTAMDSMASAFRREENNPLPEIIKAPTEEEKAVAMAEAQTKLTANLPSGYYSTFAGSVFGSSRLIKLKMTAGGGYQSKEDAEKTGTIDSWNTLIKRNQAKFKE